MLLLRAAAMHSARIFAPCNAAGTSFSCTRACLAVAFSSKRLQPNTRTIFSAASLINDGGISDGDQDDNSAKHATIRAILDRATSPQSQGAPSRRRRLITQPLESSERPQDAPSEEQQQKARSLAARMLNRRLMCSAELLGKLQEKGCSEPAAQEAVAFLQGMGLQSDEEYAEVFVRSKWRQQQKAPRMILMELKRKGVSLELASTAVRNFFGEKGQLQSGRQDAEDDDDGEGESEQGPLDVLIEQAAKKVAVMADLPREKQRRRLVAWLQRRGHGWDVVSRVLKEVKL